MGGSISAVGSISGQLGRSNSLLVCAIGVDIGQGVPLQRRSVFIRFPTDGVLARFEQGIFRIFRLCNFGCHDHGVLAEFDSIPKRGDRHLIVRQECGSTYPLAVYAGSIGATEIADENETVGFHQNAVNARNALVIETNIAVVVAADDCHVLDKFDDRPFVHGQQSGTHSSPLFTQSRLDPQSLPARI